MKNLIPLRQGDLDGLCSIYSVLNAIRYVLDYDPVDYKNDYDGACKIFKLAFQDNADLSTVLDGAEHNVPFKYLETLSEFIPIKHRKLNPSETIYENIKDDSVAIIGFTGFDDHWTVATHYDNDYLYLFDSTRYKKFKRKNIVTGVSTETNKIIIDRNDVIIVSKK